MPTRTTRRTQCWRQGPTVPAVGPASYRAHTRKVHSSASIHLASVVSDCPDGVALAEFYVEILDGRASTPLLGWGKRRTFLGLTTGPSIGAAYVGGARHWNGMLVSGQCGHTDSLSFWGSACAEEFRMS